MVCKGICIRHKALKPMKVGRYSTGQKRCQICEIYLNWNGEWCPCCGYKLRARPRSSKAKRALEARKNIGRDNNTSNTKEQTSILEPKRVVSV